MSGKHRSLAVNAILISHAPTLIDVTARHHHGKTIPASPPAKGRLTIFLRQEMILKTSMQPQSWVPHLCPTVSHLRPITTQLVTHNFPGKKRIALMGSIMTCRTVKCAAAISFAMTGLFSIPSHAADECLASPKAVTPQGSHWYYHLEKGTGRKCWYLGSQGAATRSSTDVARATPSKPDDNTNQADASKNTSAQTPPSQQLQPSVANARAELKTDASAAASNPPPALAAPDLLSGRPSATGTPSNIAGSAEALAARWPDADTFKPTASPQMLAQNSPSPPASGQAEQTAPASAAAAPVDTHTIPSQSSTITETPARVLLAAIFVLLAIAGVFARSAFHYFARTRVRVTRRRDIWAQADYGEQPFTPYEDMVTPERRSRAVPQPGENADEIEYLLRRAARREAQQRYVSN